MRASHIRYTLSMVSIVDRVALGMYLKPEMRKLIITNP